MLRFFRKITPKIIINGYHLLMPLLGAIIYGFPSKKIKVIGVTGTNGKSTTIEMISSVLKGSGYKIGLISSIKFEIAGKIEKNKSTMTMPGRFMIQKKIKDAVNSHCDYMIIEVTSEGIKQHRHLFIDFNTVLITNLSPEHIESHGGFDNYKKSKGKLFKNSKKMHIINLDDDHKNYFLSFSAKEKLGYGISFKENGINSIKAKDININSDGSSFKVMDCKFNIMMPGEFNIYNALAAISIGLKEKISLSSISNSLSEIKGIEGRMEMIISSPFKVFVDYAFTPNALEKVYQTIKENFNHNKIIAVIGSCGGGRDKWKRPVLGEIASKYCDMVIVTNEDPYDEEPEGIINQVAEKIVDPIKITDRREAIKKALNLADKNDIVIVTGKGSESWMCIDHGKKISWDDRLIIKQEFKKI
jgi:UDP-N-acetylmuramoyl-L-alanyl-D-glutamate--2,6-diaminopimelate ligase